MSDQDAQNACQEEAVQPVSPGTVLARARNSQGLSIPEVAESLKITESYVRAIEESTFDVLPQTAFVRGYIRNYARLVGLNCEDLVKDFDHFIGNDGLDTPRLQGTKKVKPLRAHSTPSPAHGLALLLVICLAGGSYYLWNYWLDAEPTEEVTEQKLSESLASAESAYLAGADTVEAAIVEKAPSADISAVVEDRSGQETETPELPVVAVDSLEAVEITEGDEVSQFVAESGKSLIIRFSEDCWVEIRDGTGETLVSAVQKAGSAINLDAFPPVSVRFGNTDGVEQIVYDGKAVARPNSSTRVASVLLTDNGQG